MTLGKFVIGQIIAAILYTLVGAYQVGVYSERMSAVEKSVDTLSHKVDRIYEEGWRR